MGDTRVGRNDPCPCGSGKKFKKCCIDLLTPAPPKTDSLDPDAPAVVLVKTPRSPNWTIEIRNFAKVREALGADVMNAFCRSFIHADRLTSIISFAHASQKLYGRDSIAFGRDLHTMVWFTIGTLRELAHAVRDCRNALAKRKMLDPASPPWVKLRDLENRWDRNEAFFNMRNKGAFHVDDDVVEAGIATILAERTHAELSRGDGSKSQTSTLTLGLEALHNGLGMDLEEYGRFLEQVTKDHEITQSIQEAFIDAGQAAGVRFGD
jgi:hypothetical protein